MTMTVNNICENSAINLLKRRINLRYIGTSFYDYILVYFQDDLSPNSMTRCVYNAAKTWKM